MKDEKMKIICSYITHKNKACILLACEKNDSINTIFKKLGFVKFSNTHKNWYMPKSKELLQQLIIQSKGIATVDVEQLKRTTQIITQTAVPNTITHVAKGSTTNTTQLISAYNLKQLELYIQTLTLKGYSPTTIRTYKNELSIFLQTLNKINADSLSTQRIKDYLAYCFNTLKLTESTVHSRMNALKFYYEQVLKQEKFFWEIPRPKKPLQLPRFFNADEIAAIINATNNIKHKAMLTLAYSCGLRVSEVVTLHTYDIDSKRMCVLVKNSKGKKDRMVSLSPILLIILRAYVKQYQIDRKGYLFEGQTKGTCYSVRSLQLVLDAAKKKANIIKPGSVHALRHSFATHLIDKGTDVTMIQKLLGHNDLKTTLIYLHTSNKDLIKVLSPLDDLNILV